MDFCNKSTKRIKAWIAEDDDKEIYLYQLKPTKNRFGDYGDGHDNKTTRIAGGTLLMDLFSDIKCNETPVEIEMIIKY